MIVFLAFVTVVLFLSVGIIRREAWQRGFTKGFERGMELKVGELERENQGDL